MIKPYMQPAATPASNGFACITLLLVASLLRNVAADWPTYQHDRSRSGSTEEAAPKNPQELWSYQSPVRPVPAWDEPALWDGWSKTHDLKNRQLFDKAFQVVVVDGHVYFGSSVDDQVRCLDASTGEQLWSFYTEGPVRLAPTCVGDSIMFGSDDGFVYCLATETGALRWKRRIGPTDRRVPGNGRVISPWAVRTGITVVDGKAFCGAGVIPSEGIYVVALNADTGSEIWRTEMKDLPAQGYMLASESKLYVVTSRDTPIVLDTETGSRLYKVKGGTGGTYALLTGDTLLYGPNKTGEVSMVSGDQELLASFQGNQIIVGQPFSYLQSGQELSALDRQSYVQLYAQRSGLSKRASELEAQVKQARDKNGDALIAELQPQIDQLQTQIKQLGEDMKGCLQWRVPCQCPYSLIRAGETLIAGGDSEVIAVAASSGELLWQISVTGKAYGLAVSNDRLLVSTDEGSVHCFGSATIDHADSTSVENGRRATATSGKQVTRVRRPPQVYPGPIASADRIPAEIHGPFTEFVAPGRVRITWDSDEPMSTVVSFGVDMTNARRWSKPNLVTQHEIVIDDVLPEMVYHYQVGGTNEAGLETLTDPYRFDSYLNYLPAFTTPRVNPFPATERGQFIAELAKAMLHSVGSRRGYILVLGAADGQLTYELARQSEHGVVVVDHDAERISQLRKLFDSVGLYGSRVAFHGPTDAAVKDGFLKPLDYGPFLANLIVSEQMMESGSLPCELEQIYRSLRPAGGNLILGGMTGDSMTFASMRADNRGTWTQLPTSQGEFWGHRRDKLESTGEWTHQYASADNAACSRDETIRGEMMVQWWGRPGARPMPDRGNRNPPPVSANGRLYVQGNRTLFGLDAYNGAILWAKQIPTMRRANMPRDGSNMVATDDHVCVAIGDKCVVFDGQTGERIRDFAVPELSPLHQYDWGFVSRIGGQLFGSGVRRGSQYLGDKGEWYEGYAEDHVAKVTSDSIFALDSYTGEEQWLHSHGVIINSTITIADGKLFFIESRSEAARDAPTGRLFAEVLPDQFLVALDATNGMLLWEKPYDFSQCRYVTYMTHANGTLLVTGTDEKSVFHTYAFDAGTGDELWQHDAPDKKGHHTGQLAHPTIVGDRVYFNKHTYALRSGEVLGTHDFNWHGCGVMSASNHTVFSRYEFHGMLDLSTGQRTEFLGVRSGCWLSLIPSGGLLLAPETSAGCSCGHAIQTSIAFVPKVLAEQNLLPPLASPPSTSTKE